VHRLKEQFYRSVYENYEKTVEAIGINVVLNHEDQNDCSLNKTMHFSFDYAQQVHIPPKMWNFWGHVRGDTMPNELLIDEASSTGKGANTTISYVHYFFSHHGLGESTPYENL